MVVVIVEEDTRFVTAEVEDCTEAIPLQLTVKPKVPADKILRPPRVRTPPVVLPVAVPERVPVGVSWIVIE